MTRPNYKDRLLASIGTSGQAEVAPQRLPTNARRLAAAHKHLDKMFADAESEQIDGRSFYGRIILEIPFEAGTAQSILASRRAEDRVSGGR
jgi:hypothetical protein